MTTRALTQRRLHAHVGIRVARTRDELESAYRLVYREYVRRDYTNENSIELRYSIFNALPQTTTFIALAEQRIIATATIILDSPLGLPLDQIYSSELAGLRARSKKLVEVSMLATDSEFFKSAAEAKQFTKHSFMLYFFKVLLDYVTYFIKYDVMCIAVHPKSSAIFDTLLFKNLGAVTAYPDVKGAPAVGKYLEVATVQKGFSKPGKEKLYDIFVTQRTSDSHFCHKKTLTQQELEDLFAHKNPFLKKMSSHQLDYIKTCYPFFDFTFLR